MFCYTCWVFFKHRTGYTEIKCNLNLKKLFDSWKRQVMKTICRREESKYSSMGQQATEQLIVSKRRGTQPT